MSTTTLTATALTHDYEPGDHVEYHWPGHPDHEMGTVRAVDGDQITVHWDGNHTTTEHVDHPDIDHVAPCARCGRQRYALQAPHIVCTRCGLRREDEEE